MTRKPRSPKESILDKGTFAKSIMQGLAIFIVAFSLYLINIDNISVARTMGITTLILSSLFLVLVNSSRINSVIYSLKQLIKDKIMWIAVFATMLIIGIVVYTPMNGLLRFTPLNLFNLLIVIAASFVGVFWYEGVKLILRKRSHLVS